MTELTQNFQFNEGTFLKRIKGLYKEAFSIIREKISFFIVVYTLKVTCLGGIFYASILIGEEHQKQVYLNFLELFIVFYISVFVLHSLNQKEERNKLTLLLESLYLLPGFLLQSIFMALSVVIGLVLLILPGLYGLTVFHLAPSLSVLMPDYKGKIFKLGITAAREDYYLNLGLFFTLLLPQAFIYGGGHLLEINPRSLIYFLQSPLSDVFNLFSEVVIFVYLSHFISKFKADRND